MVFNNNKTSSAKYEKEIENIAHFRLLIIYNYTNNSRFSD